MGDTEREWQRHRQREKQAPCREPDVGLDPETPGSRAGPKVDAQWLSHPGIPSTNLLRACHPSLLDTVGSGAPSRVRQTCNRRLEISLASE